MEKEILDVAGVKKSDYAFNHVVKAGPLLFLTSQLSCDLKTGELLKGSAAFQTKKAMENIKYLLEQSLSSLDRIVDVTIYMRNAEDFASIDTAYRQYFAAGNEPARVSVQAPSPLEGIDVEIKVTALAHH